MKITRHTARDMRAALRKVREQLGPEAVILTSKRMPFGVEVTAAIDFDAAHVEAQAQVVESAEELAPAAAGGTAAASSGVAGARRAGTNAQSSRGQAAAAQPQKFQPEEFATVARGEDEEDDSNVQLSPFARLQAEMLQASPVRARNGEVKAVNSPAPARAVQKPSAEDSSDGSRARGAELRSPDDLWSASERRAEEFRAAIERRAGQLRGASDSHGIENSGVGQDVHAALESAIDSYMAADDGEQGEDSTPATQSRPNQHTARASAAERISATDDEDGEESALSAELKAMRRILETQMAQLAWNDLSRRAPIHTEILRELTEVGLSQEFAAQIVAQLPVGTDLIKARRLSISLIAHRLNVIGDRWLDKGGQIALVGPTGVGKTTALAKLAVRWVLRHGARNIALISADGVRIGAHDQLQALGQMLDVPVCIAESLAEIPRALDHFAQKRLVLIDTPGMSQRDPQLAERMAQLASPGSNVETALVLSASTQAGAIAETVARFSTAKVKSVLLTKVDEAASLGGVLSVLARAELPISYVSEGQRVPEDLRPARALELVSSAVQLAKTSGAAADEDLLRRRYGEVAHALA
jgi:flagellar biosynthesis protein FlhF